uniref:Secreted protein n=1 Tax=Globodera rostochiensis TaxID=31243 RepID=A0A914H7A2_GLORO
MRLLGQWALVCAEFLSKTSRLKQRVPCRIAMRTPRGVIPSRFASCDAGLASPEKCAKKAGCFALLKSFEIFSMARNLKIAGCFCARVVTFGVCALRQNVVQTKSSGFG